MLYFMQREGELAQLVERVLSMHEVAGSIPAFSTCFLFDFLTFWSIFLPFFQIVTNWCLCIR
jgi:hypothetical protein